METAESSVTDGASEYWAAVIACLAYLDEVEPATGPPRGTGDFWAIAGRREAQGLAARREHLTRRWRD